MPFRRSYFAQLIEQQAPALWFGDLLRQLDPIAYARVAPQGGLAVYEAIIKHVSDLFPILEIDFDIREQMYLEAIDEGYEIDDEGFMGDGEEGRAENIIHEPQPYNTLLDAWEYGLPVSPVGTESFQLREYTDTPALSLCQHIVVRNELNSNPLVRQDPGWLKHHRRYLDLAQVGTGCLTRLTAPNGREWIKPWGAVADMVRYVDGDTGYMLLDYSIDEAEEMGLPRWDIDEINGFAAEWKQAKPIHDGIMALANYIDAKPAKRLPILLRLLTGHEPTRNALSKPIRTKTLVEVFA